MGAIPRHPITTLSLLILYHFFSEGKRKREKGRVLATKSARSSVSSFFEKLELLSKFFVSKIYNISKS